MRYIEAEQCHMSEVAVLHNELAYTIQKVTNDCYWDFDKLTTDNISKHLESFINNPERRVFIAEENNTVIGFIGCEKIQCHLPISSINQVGFITAAYVKPEYRGQGIMKELENTAISFFKELGVKFIEVYYLSENIPAKGFWQSMGYKPYREQARKSL